MQPIDPNPENPDNMPSQPAQPEPQQIPEAAPPVPEQTSMAPSAPSTATAPGQPAPQSQIAASEPTAMPLQQPAVTPKGRGNQRKAMALVLVAAVLLAAVTAVFAIRASANSPDKVFRAAMEDALSTKQVEQDASTSSGTAVSGKILYDVSDTHNPKAYTAVSIGSSDTYAIKLDGYSTFKNSYVRFEKGGFVSQVPSLSQYAGQWVALRQNGAVVPGVDSSTLDLIDVRVAAFGDLMFGNFSAADREQLVKFIVDNHVYQYDANKVTSSKLDGQSVLVYDITENQSQLKALNQKIAELMGLDAQGQKEVVNALSPAGKAKMYIATGSHHIVRVTASSDGTDITNNYTHYGDVTLPDEPKPTLSWQQLQQGLSQTPLDMGGGSGADNSSVI